MIPRSISVKVVLMVMVYASGLLPASAQSLRYPLAQPYINLSAYSLQQNDALSFTGNQAALAQLKQVGVGIFGVRRFMLKETSEYTLGAALPTRLGNLGIQLNYGGFRNFNETRIGLAYARKLGKFVDVGVQFNYYGYKVPAYNNASALYFELGAIMHLSDKLNAGVHVYNPVGGKLSTSAPLNTSAPLSVEKLASVYKMGIGYDASDKFFIGAEIMKEENKPVDVVAGFQYHFAKQFFAKAGFVSGSTMIYAGAGVGWMNLRLDISSAYHPKLGFSPGVLLIMQFKRKKE